MLGTLKVQVDSTVEASTVTNVLFPDSSYTKYWYHVPRTSLKHKRHWELFRPARLFLQIGGPFCGCPHKKGQAVRNLYKGPWLFGNSIVLGVPKILQ